MDFSRKKVLSASSKPATVVPTPRPTFVDLLRVSPAVFYGNVAPLDTVAPKAAVGCAHVTSGPLVKESASDGHVVLGNVG
jgi:hypothetical protein